MNLSDITISEPSGASVQLADVIASPTVIVLTRYFG